MNKITNADQARDYVQQVAEHRQWKLNSDSTLIDPILAGLAKNAGRYGKPFCPCRDTDGQLAQDRDIICPCAYAQADIQEWGQCYCGLFLSEQKQPTEVSSIPERRP